MKVFVIGSGGREHAIAWALARNTSIGEIVAAPGNGGLAEIARCVRADVGNPRELADVAEAEGVALTFVGPELPLVNGVVDEFSRRGLKIIGPDARAARLEGSKAFAKEFMARHGIPTARFTVCDSVAEARRAIAARRFDFPVVIKADGLAAGKGVSLAHTPEEAEATIERLMVEKALGAAGERIVLEECLTGRECSFLLFTDGEFIVPLPPAQDYKRAQDGDQGSNTGGMGAISTPHLLDEAMRERILREIAWPTIRAAAREGFPYRGVLYIGLMLTPEGPRVLEYNVRLGDPEAQAILPRLENDLLEIGEALAAGELSRVPLRWREDSTVCVVLASGGYPGTYQTGYPIRGLEEARRLPEVVIFHAGTTRMPDGSFLTAGGRVLNVVAGGRTLAEARSRAYAAASLITFERMHYRRDIGAEWTPA
ncbi:MAG: phosphoribosylamine--glycine ligase [Blastocatellia bacterium]|nr:phosphoribosylamine--glycine ligase [Blastocatellia bacterium]